MKIVPVILAGGKGERFWPLSTPENPKQCLPLVSDQPMIVDTYNRLKDFDDFFIVANSFLCDKFRKLLPERVNYIEEPYARNTAPAIGLACITLLQKYGDCIVFFETADHYYEDISHYIDDIKNACTFASDHDKIVLIGISPKNPHTGYGYIKSGSLVENDIFLVDSFKEKPDLPTAQKYVNDGNYNWNSGMFIGKCSVMLREIEKSLPSLFSGLQRIKEGDFSKDLLSKEFSKFEKISIDYGVLERSNETVVLQSTMPWDDIGDFNAVTRILNPDSEGNFSKKPIHSLDSHGNIVISNKLVALIDVDDIIVVDTKDALLICRRTESQKIRELVKSLDQKE